MIKSILLMHPQSADLISRDAFASDLVECISISCGASKVANADLSEAADFFPTYASWNSSLFETSIIMTVWEHADNLIGNNHIAFLHTDVQLHFDAIDTWKRIDDHLNADQASSMALTAPNAYRGLWNDWIVDDGHLLIPKNDPYKIHCFDNGIFIWNIIKEYDHDIYEWAFDTQPLMIYGHQFACSRATFDYLGGKLNQVIDKIRLRDVGLWTPHVFERLIALYLARRGPPTLTTAFWHYQSSGIYGPGDHSLYGPRPVRYYKVYKNSMVSCHTSGPKKTLQETQTNRHLDLLSTISRR